MNTKDINNIAFFDVDNTIVDGYTQKYFIKFLIKNNKLSRVFILFYAIWFLLYKLHIIKNAGSAIKLYVKYLRGNGVGEMSQLVEEFFDTEIERRIFSGARQEINEQLSKGNKVVLVSMSLFPIIEIIAEHLGVEDFIATDVEVVEGKYTGKIVGRVIEGEHRYQIVKSNIGKHNKKVYFYTDHYTDLPILESVDFPVVVNPDNILYNKALKGGWKILNFS